MRSTRATMVFSEEKFLEISASPTDDGDYELRERESPWCSLAAFGSMIGVGELRLKHASELPNGVEQSRRFNHSSRFPEEVLELSTLSVLCFFFLGGVVRRTQNTRQRFLMGSRAADG